MSRPCLRAACARVLLAGLGLDLVGCGSADEERGCPIDTAAHPQTGEFLVTFAPSSFANVSDGSSSGAPVMMAAGFVIMRLPVPECQPLPQMPCDVHMNRLRFELSGFAIGDVRIEKFRLGFDQRLILRDQGAGATLPQSAPLAACASIDGTGMVAKEVTPSSMTMFTDAATGQLTLRGEVDAVFEFKSTELTNGRVLAPVTLTLKSLIRASGLREWQAG